METKPKYRIYPSLLDSYQDYLDAEILWDQFYGSSEEPAMTVAEFEAKQYRELLDSINRVPFESEAASRGTCLNTIVDYINGATDGPKDVAVKSLKLSPDQTLIAAAQGRYMFFFDAGFCRTLAARFKGAARQVFCRAVLQTGYGPVELYGYADEVLRDVVYDIKYTGRYDFGKYERHWQRHTYPWALIESGQVEAIEGFEYTAVKMGGGTTKSPLLTGDIIPEYYTYDHRESTERLRDICERFIEFLEFNRDQITDKKIFGADV